MGTCVMFVSVGHEHADSVAVADSQSIGVNACVADRRQSADVDARRDDDDEVDVDGGIDGGGGGGGERLR